MKINRSRIAAALAGGLLLAAAGASIAGLADQENTGAAPGPRDGGPHPWGHGGPDGPMHLYKKLGLTSEQQASVKAIMTASKPQMEAMREQMRANHLKATQIKPDDPNYGNVMAEVAQSNAALASQHTTHMAEIRAQMYALLTPAQKTQLATLEAEQAAHPDHGPGPHAPD